MTITHRKTTSIPSLTQPQLDAAIAAGQYPSGTTLAQVILSADWNDTHDFNLAIADITGLQTELTNLANSLAGKADAIHTHAISQIINLQTTLTNLQNDINGKANASHSHAINDVTGLQTALNAKLDDADVGVTVQAFDAQTTKNNVANVFTQPNDFVKTFADWTAETFNATQTLDALVPAGTTTLTGNMTLNAVSNSTTGEMQVIVRAFTQDATGGRTLAYNTSVFSASGASFPQPTSTANRVSLFQFTKMPNGLWAVQSLNDVRST